jgi:hypothetical protein
LNLCGEEYLYYDKGYINPEVWRAWRNGMKYYLADQRILNKWADEEKSGSYYGLTLRKIRQNASRTGTRQPRPSDWASRRSEVSGSPGGEV